MAVYFPGRERIAAFEQPLDEGRGRLDWEVFEEWIDIDQSTTARCGMPGSCAVEKSVGISEKTSQTLKGSRRATMTAMTTCARSEEHWTCCWKSCSVATRIVFPPTKDALPT